MSSVLILGRQTNIALAELESLYGAENFKLINSNCVLTDIGNIDLPRLGGSIKIAKVIDEYNNTSWLDIEKILHKNIGNFLNLPIEGKLNLGISLYGLNVNLNKLQNLTIQLKKSIKKYGQSVRLLPSSSLQLNSAQVIHNKLLSEKGAEILIIQSPNSVIIAKTIDEQDINSYSQRDYNRPKRDSKVGMLPPKLAQILINLANPKNNSTVLDPFCGTGVILQEALLDKFNAYGTDLEARMIDYSQVNMDWLAEKYTIQNNLKLETGDATNFIWQPFDNVVAETYLGQAYSIYPDSLRLKDNIRNCDVILSKFLKNIHNQVPIGGKLSLALPAWYDRDTKKFLTLPLIDHFPELGYNRLSFSIVNSDDLFYHREGQIVARQLILLTRNK